MGRRTRRLLGVTVALGGLALGSSLATSANAETGVWHQSYERASAQAECPAPEGETPWQDSYSGQREWTPSWAQWANGGTGGWVCNRNIVWAQVVVSNCQFVGALAEVDYFAQFGGGWSAPAGSPQYTDPSCSVAGGTLGQYFVLASSETQANARCAETDPNYIDGNSARLSGTDVWICNQFG